MFDKSQTRKAFTFCVLFLLLFAFSGQAQKQPSPSTNETKSLQERITILEERIQLLESKLGAQEASNQTDDDIHSLKAELVSLQDEIKAFRLALEMQRKRMSRLQISGEQRTRFMNIKTKGETALGTFGEIIKQEATFKHYLRLDVTTVITDHLSAGGRIRISNVSKNILDDGPEYLSQEWGSAFLIYSAKNFNATVGCYDVHFTPLTLMRWDMENNPEGGSEAGTLCLDCGGIVGGGIIPSESLEELSPRLSFEGARLNTMISDHIDVVTVYARTHEAVSSYPRSFRRHLYGVRTKFLLYHSPSTSFRHLGVTLLSCQDEKSSLTHAPGTPLPEENDVLGLDFDFPIFKSLLLRGEWVHTKFVKFYFDEPKKTAGDAMVIGLKTQWFSLVNWRIAYLRIDKSYRAQYSALSYAENRKGFRTAFTLETPKWNSTFSLFYKMLQEIEPEENGDGNFLHTFYTAGMGFSIIPIKNLTFRPSYIYLGIRKDEDPATEKIDRVKEDKGIFIGEIVLSLNKDNQFILRYQDINSNDRVNPDMNYGAGTFSVLFTLRF